MYEKLPNIMLKMTDGSYQFVSTSLFCISKARKLKLYALIIVKKNKNL
jgi:hypothetical protein